MVYQKHKNSIKTLSYGMDKFDIDDSIVQNFKDFSQLSNLSLYNISLSINGRRSLDMLQKIEILFLSNRKRRDYNSRNGEGLFFNEKLYLSRLTLKAFSLSEIGMYFLGYR